MNQTIQFTTRVHQGQIVIPTELMNGVEDNLEIEVIIKPKQSQQQDRLMDRLAQNPLVAEGWRDLNRDVLHARRDD
jgi:hypothetical protein